MTLQLMEQFGVQASRDAGTHMYRIPRQAMANPSDFLVEGIVERCSYFRLDPHNVLRMVIV